MMQKRTVMEAETSRAIARAAELKRDVAGYLKVRDQIPCGMSAEVQTWVQARKEEYSSFRWHREGLE